MMCLIFRVPFFPDVLDSTTATFFSLQRMSQNNSDDLHSGGRALPAIVRPFAARVAGQPLESSFDSSNRIYRLVFQNDESNVAGNVRETVIFVPQYQYGVDPRGMDIELSDGSYKLFMDSQTLVYTHSDGASLHTLIIRPHHDHGRKEM